MTPQLREAIQLLAMSHHEILQFIDAQVLSNPLLEVDAPARPETPTEPYSHSTDGPRNPDFDPQARLANIGGKPSLWEHLNTQVALFADDPRMLSLATVLIYELDSDGYLRTGLAEIGERLGINAAEIEGALAILQRCEPTGVGARDLAECLGLQLAEAGHLSPGMLHVLTHIEDLAGPGLDALRRDITAMGEDFETLRGRIKRLNPTPSAAFETGMPHYAIPDVLVSRNNLGGWSVELNPDALPRVIMNNDYLVETGADGGVEKFVRDCVAKGSWLIKALDQRAQSILKVAAEIARVQDGFFTSGISGLRPLTLRDVADQVGLHESTVSRVTKGKYLSCERGQFEMRFFFTQAIPSLSGGDSVSSAVVQDKIRRLVEQEAPSAVLSDDKLVKLLRKDGIDIARRTVSKYREAMQIPSSVERRRSKSGSVKIRP